MIFLTMIISFFASIFAGIIAYISALFIDLENISNEEGLVTLLIVAVITLVVGVIKIRSYFASLSILTKG